ncbi:hypothetical protein F892_00733 [Acinetobacter vivianii]|jgi:hypothetical protein|uniref:Uncharacterized protein n=1 Tax=Acinetobacter vivianii TaxID=1776742 RepID=N9PUY9_9GAMM|nr:MULTISPECIES: hypothetical protein [Acinetobacter]ENX21501.1 hypothetical protein F892_00733 [Acinetobacter vivianii]GGI61315.1 hypothetical protein GCM10011446_28100 [Acinetobacter vivianii]
MLDNTVYSSELLLSNIIQVILNLDDEVGKLVFDGLKASFAIDSKEYQYLANFDLIH